MGDHSINREFAYLVYEYFLKADYSLRKDFVPRGEKILSLKISPLKGRQILSRPVISFECVCLHLGPVVQSMVSLTSLLRVISLTVLADSIYNILIFFA